MTILTRFRSGSRRSWTPEEELQHVRDVLSLPETPQNNPKIIACLERLIQDHCVPEPSETAIDMLLIGDPLALPLLSTDHQVAGLAIDLANSLLEIQPAEFRRCLNIFCPNLLVVMDRSPETEKDNRAARAAEIVETLVIQHRFVEVVPHLTRALKSDQEDTQLAVAEILVVVAETFKANELEQYVEPLAEAIEFCANKQSASMQRCAVRIYLPFLRIPNEDVKKFQKGMSHTTQRNLSNALRKMLSERQQSKKESRPSATIRRRSVVPPPSLHQIIEENSDKKSAGKKKNQVANGTVRSRSSVATRNSTATEDRAPSPLLSMHFGVADKFADEAFGELSRFVADEELENEYEEKWEVRSTPEAVRTSTDSNDKPSLHRSASNNHLAKAGFMGSIRSGSQRIRRQLSAKSWFAPRKSDTL